MSEHDMQLVDEMIGEANSKRKQRYEAAKMRLDMAQKREGELEIKVSVAQADTRAAAQEYFIAAKEYAATACGLRDDCLSSHLRNIL